MKKLNVLTTGLAVLLFGFVLFHFYIGRSGEITESINRITVKEDGQRIREDRATKVFRNEDGWIEAYKAVQPWVEQRVNGPVDISFPRNSEVVVTRKEESQDYTVESYAWFNIPPAIPSACILLQKSTRTKTNDGK